MAPGHVSVHVLSAGYLTLPEAFFVTPLDDPTARKRVPSLSFLIQHTSATARTAAATPTRIVFDLGIRRRLDHYAPPIYRHVQTRMPTAGDPDTVAALAEGGLAPPDIDFVVLSHLHWDHVGTPGDYPTSTFVVGPGALGLLDGTAPRALGGHSHFEADLLDRSRTIQLGADGDDRRPSAQASPLFARPWAPLGLFPAAMDVFGDGSLHVVSAPGHLEGHINLLCRLASGRYLYLAGDACHDGRILAGTKSMATWTDEATGCVCCIHQDKARAEQTIAAIRATMHGGVPELGKVEVVLAHDAVWEAAARQAGWFFPGMVS